MVSGYAREIRFFQCCNLHNIIFIIQYIGHPSPVARPGKKIFDNPVSWAGNAQFYCFML